MKKDIHEEIKRKSSFSKEVKINNSKNKSQDIVKIDSMELPTAIGEKEEKHFQRVDKQGDLFSDFFSDFKK
ncbi:hypothetical protein [Flavobacterium sp. LB2P44]|uniref:hypothetical protein n=1 Tax=Flavobacterium sp. LB2P44 TaxID=3401713 RepID=UPI003AAAC932